MERGEGLEESSDRDTAFFAGYSFDSFIDIILTRFDTSVNTATDKIRKRLAPAPA